MVTRIVPSLFLIAAITAHADLAVDFDHGKGSLEFRAVGRPSALKIVGKGDRPKGSLLLSAQGLAGGFRFELESLDTGIELRNHHMKEKYLQTQTYPVASLRVTQLGIPFERLSTDFDVSNSTFEGILTLHGVEKPVMGKMSVKRVGETLQGSASFQLKLSDFMIGIPSFMGITVADLVDVETAFDAPLVQSGKIISTPKE